MSLKNSPWIIHYDGSSCNGCDIEVLACLTPLYDVERLGIINTGNPKHADVFLITGSINEQNREVVHTIYHQMPDPKVVIAIGICATSGGIFAECYNVEGGVDQVIPVDVYVPGCAARPELIIDGIIKALDILVDKGSQLKRMAASSEGLAVSEACLKDAKELFELQKSVYKSEAEMHTDFSLSLLEQAPQEVKDDFKTKTFLKATFHGKIVGSVRACMKDETCFIERLFVDPMYHHHGIGDKLLYDMEEHFRDAQRYETFTGEESQRNIVFLKKHSYRSFKKEKGIGNVTLVYFQKIS